MFATPPQLSQYGYATKVWLAAQLELLHLGGTHFVWFARELNPIQNGESSNPLALYREIDTAVKKRDINHPKIKDLRANLLTVVARFVKPRNPSLARALRRQILGAPIEMFRAQIWRLNLSAIAPNRWDTNGATAGWDEQHVNHLTAKEFEIIVE
jgi:hypothetical protein